MALGNRELTLDGLYDILHLPAPQEHSCLVFADFSAEPFRKSGMQCFCCDFEFADHQVVRNHLCSAGQQSGRNCRDQTASQSRLKIKISSTSRSYVDALTVCNAILDHPAAEQNGWFNVLRMAVNDPELAVIERTSFDKYGEHAEDPQPIRRLERVDYFESDDSDKEDSSSDNDSGYADPSSDSDKKRSISTFTQRRRVKQREDADETVSSDSLDQLVYTSPETQRHYTRESEPAGSKSNTGTNKQDPCEPTEPIQQKGLASANDSGFFEGRNSPAAEIPSTRSLQSAKLPDPTRAESAMVQSRSPVAAAEVSAALAGSAEHLQLPELKAPVLRKTLKRKNKTPKKTRPEAQTKRHVMEVLDSSDPPGELPSDARFATPALVQCKTEATPLQPLPEPRQQTVAVKREQIPNSSSGGNDISSHTDSIRAFFNKRKPGLGDATWEALAAAHIASPAELFQLEDKATFDALLRELATIPVFHRFRLTSAVSNADFGK